MEINGANSHAEEYLSIDKSKDTGDAEDTKGSDTVITEDKQDGKEVSGASSHAEQLLPIDTDKDHEDTENTIGSDTVSTEDKQGDTEVKYAKSCAEKPLQINNSKDTGDAEDTKGSDTVITEDKQDGKEVSGASSHAEQLLPIDTDKDHEDTENTIGSDTVSTEDKQGDTEVKYAKSCAEKPLQINNSKDTGDAEDTKGSDTVITEDKQDGKEVSGASSHAEQLLPIDTDKDHEDTEKTIGSDTVSTEDKQGDTEVKYAKSCAEKPLQINNSKDTGDAEDTKGSDTVITEDKQDGKEVSGASSHAEQLLPIDTDKDHEDTENTIGSDTVSTEDKQGDTEVKYAKSCAEKPLQINNSKDTGDAEDTKGSDTVITEDKQDGKEVSGASSHAEQLLPIDTDNDHEDTENTIGSDTVSTEDKQGDTEVKYAKSCAEKPLQINNSKDTGDAEDTKGSDTVITEDKQDGKEVSGASSHAEQLLPIDTDKDHEDTENTIGSDTVSTEDKQGDTEVKYAKSCAEKPLQINNSKDTGDAEDTKGSDTVITEDKQDGKEVSGASSHAEQLLPIDTDKDHEDTENTIGSDTVSTEDKQGDTEVKYAKSCAEKPLQINNSKDTGDAEDTKGSDTVITEDKQDGKEVSGASSHAEQLLPIDTDNDHEDTENTIGSDTVSTEDKQGDTEVKYAKSCAEKPLQINNEKPGKPEATKIKAYSLMLSWEKPEAFEAGDHYQVRYKDINAGKKWHTLPNEYTSNTITVTERKAKTKYIFQVRMIKDEEEGPYSEASDEVCTDVSPGARLKKQSKLVKFGTPSLYALPLTELARCDKAKLKTFEIGKSHHIMKKEKTIMLVGATGTGKSTIVDGFVNHFLDVNWNDPFRFTVISLEEEERLRMDNKAVSLTEWITCYTINPEKGNSLDYRLNIIDTPGFGDTRGLDRDQEIVEQIRELFLNTSGAGVTCIDAVCFLNKASDARLTTPQKYIFDSIMSIFGKDIEHNICSLITFADGQTPPVIASLKASNLPFGPPFVFNNSVLFSTNTNLDSSSLSQIFWEMSGKGYRDFFEYLFNLETKSLCLTKRVLDERQKLQLTISCIQPQVDAGLSTLSALKQEMKIIKQHESDIIDNKDFTYEVEESHIVKTDLEKGHHVTNCPKCNQTCHYDCIYANDEDKAKCSVFDSDGNCKYCPEICNWKEHTDMPYMFEFKLIKVKKTYQEKLKKYQDATGQKLNAEQVVKKMREELNELEGGIQLLMANINEINNRLNAIALRPNPLSIVDHIDLMIKSEKLDKKDGFQGRIEVLMDYKQKAQVPKDVERFNKEAMQTSRGKSEKEGDNEKSKVFFSFWAFLNKRLFSKPQSDDCCKVQLEGICFDT